jgi:hypothetical protein
MKRFLLYSLLLLLPAIMVAQPAERFDAGFDNVGSDPDRSPSRFDFGNDDLIAGLPFNLERIEFIQILEQQKAEIVHSSEDSIEAKKDGNLIRASFVEDRVRSILITLGSLDADESSTSKEVRSFIVRLAYRATMFEDIAGGRIFYHRKSDGAWMRSMARQIDSTIVLVEVGLGAPGITALPIDTNTVANSTSLSYKPASFGLDVFLPGIPIGMTRPELMKWTDGSRWKMVRTTEYISEYQLWNKAALGTLLVRFANGRAESMSLIVTVAPKYRATIRRIVHSLTGGLARRGELIHRWGNDSTFAHTTSDGRKVQSFVTTKSDFEVTIGSRVMK